MKKIFTLLFAIVAVVSMANAQGFSTSNKKQTKTVLNLQESSLNQSIDQADTTYSVYVNDDRFKIRKQEFLVASGTKQETIDFLVSCLLAFDELDNDESLSIDNSRYVSSLTKFWNATANAVILYSKGGTDAYGYLRIAQINRMLKYFGVDAKAIRKKK